jgi:GT2 family glycosyltransferase
MLTKTPSVGIVLLSLNRFSMTSKCIKSLLSVDYPKFSIVVVDNNSADNSGEKLKESFPEITLLQSKINLGFCGGNNLGIKYCLAAQFDYIMILNDDTEVEPDFLSIMVQKGVSIPEKLHVITGKICCNQDRTMVWYAGGDLSFIHGIGKHRGHFKKDRPEYNNDCKVEYASGCLMLVKGEVFETIGLLKESIFIYLDDTEFCIRLREASIPIYYQAASRIYHKVQAGIGLANYTPFYLYYSSRNRVLITRNIYYRLYLLVYSWIIATIKIVILAVLPFADKKLIKIGSIMRGTIDATLIFFRNKDHEGLK